MMEGSTRVYEKTKEVGPLLLPVQEIDPQDYHVGVIVARFQVSKLTPAHEALIDYMTSRHGKQLILLGVPLVTGEMPNPLDYASREQMIKTNYPEAVVLPVIDFPDDNDAWIREVDKAIFIAFGREDKALLYGSRDSFIPYYHGRNKTQQLDTNKSEISGTESRKNDSKIMRNSVEWRAGNIHAISQKRPVSYVTVDIAGFSPEGLMLIGQKAKDGDKWRFIGGFKEVDNISIEEVAMREFWEETGEASAIIDPQYILSMNINDPRYRSTKNTIFTILMAGMIESPDFISTGSDDVKNVAWINLNYFLSDENKLGKNIGDFFIPEHVPLMAKFLSKITDYKSSWIDSVKSRIPLIADFLGKFKSGSSTPWLEVIKVSDKRFKSDYPIISIEERKKANKSMESKTESIHNFLNSEETHEETNQSHEK